MKTSAMTRNRGSTNEDSTSTSKRRGPHKIDFSTVNFLSCARSEGDATSPWATLVAESFRTLEFYRTTICTIRQHPKPLRARARTRRMSQRHFNSVEKLVGLAESHCTKKSGTKKCPWWRNGAENPRLPESVHDRRLWRVAEAFGPRSPKTLSGAGFPRPHFFLRRSPIEAPGKEITKRRLSRFCSALRSVGFSAPTMRRGRMARSR